MISRVASKLLTASLLFMLPDYVITANADSIYDAKIEERLKLDPGQMPKVEAIVKQSQADRDVVFRKYGIDPNAKPDLDLLTKASDELKAIGYQERKQLKEILSKAQLKQYDKIISQTSARVGKAANPN
jgi:hypothetical protein